MATIRFLFGSNRNITVPVLLAVSVFLILVLTTHPRNPRFVEVSGEGELRSYKQSSGDVAFTLRPGAFHSFKFVVPDDHTDASLKGQFSVAGQDKNGVEAFVLQGEDYTSWQDGYTTYRYYDSGNVRRGSVDVPLPIGTGTYYVVFTNRLPADDSKSVRTNMSLVFHRRWWPGTSQ